MSDTKTKYVTFRDLQRISKQSPAENDPPAQARRTNKPQSASQVKRSTQRSINRSISDRSVSANQTLSARQAHESVPERVSANQTLSARLALTQNIAGHTAIPNLILDALLSQLRVQDQAVYLRLYRLSHGFHSKTCKVGFEKLANACNISRREVVRSIEKLEALGLIKRLGCDFKVPLGIERGNLYQVNLPEVVSANQTPTEAVSANQTLSAGLARFKEDHDDLKRRSSSNARAREKNDDDFSSHITDHQKQTQKLYEQITGNGWQKSDEAAYQKIKEIDLAKIELAISLATQRAASRPNSLNYFVKEILNLAHPSKQSHVQQKKALEKIVRQVRDNHVGGNHSMADFVEDVKRACARAGVTFENDLFNEIIEKR